MEEPLDRDKWLHHLHSWDEPGAEHETIASVTEVEEILALELVRISSKDNLINGQDDSPLFYHDHHSGGKLILVGSGFYVEPSRAGLLRVIGCGHFLLSLYRQFIDNTVRIFAHRKDLLWFTDFLRGVSAAWLRGPLNPAVPCNSGIGIGQHFNEFTSTWLTMNISTKFRPEEAANYLMVRGVQYQCRTKCFSGRSQDMASKFRNAYKEFLFLHMCCIVKWPPDHEVTNSTLILQYCQMNRKLDFPVLSALLNTRPVLLIASEVENAVKQWARKKEKMKRKAAKFYTSVSSEEYFSLEYCSEYSETMSESVANFELQPNTQHLPQIANGASKTKMVQISGGSTSEADFTQGQTKTEFINAVIDQSSISSRTVEAGGVSTIGTDFSPSQTSTKFTNVAIDQSSSKYLDPLQSSRGSAIGADISRSQTKTGFKSKVVRDQSSSWTVEGGVKAMQRNKAFKFVMPIGSRDSLTTQWTRYENFSASEWMQMDDGKLAKVVDAHWKLGCKGCPGSAQQMATKSDEQKKCKKWVTAKRTVLVKRPSEAEQ